jgi:hypothetical protein
MQALNAAQKCIIKGNYSEKFVRNRTGTSSSELKSERFSGFLMLFSLITAWHICWQ